MSRIPPHPLACSLRPPLLEHSRICWAATVSPSGTAVKNTNIRVLTETRRPLPSHSLYGSNCCCYSAPRLTSGHRLEFPPHPPPPREILHIRPFITNPPRTHGYVPLSINMVGALWHSAATTLTPKQHHETKPGTDRHGVVNSSSRVQSSTGFNGRKGAMTTDREDSREGGSAVISGIRQKRLLCLCYTS